MIKIVCNYKGKYYEIEYKNNKDELNICFLNVNQKAFKTLKMNKANDKKSIKLKLKNKRILSMIQNDNSRQIGEYYLKQLLISNNKI